MSKPATTEPVPPTPSLADALRASLAAAKDGRTGASPPRPPDPDTAHLRHEVRRILRDSSLDARERDLIAAAQEYAAALIEKCARPAQRGAS